MVSTVCMASHRTSASSVGRHKDAQTDSLEQAACDELGRFSIQDSQLGAGLTLPVQSAVAKAALDLRRHGWAVVDDVIPLAECNAYIDGVWRWLESLGTGIRRDDESTWTSDRWPPTFGDGSNGICNRLEVAHQDFVWRIRSDPRVTSIFAGLWGTDALLSSFDSINVMRPPAAVARLAKHNCAVASGRVSGSSSGSWWHTDQAPTRQGLECVQGLINMTPVGSDAGTLMVRHGSHVDHARFWREASVMSPVQQRDLGDFYIYKPEEMKFWEGFPAVAVSGHGPGSLFLWDSRTVHHNRPPTNTSLWRHVLYCCYQPAQMASADDIAQKQRAYNEFLVTTHWPAKNVTCGAPNSDDETATYALPRTRHHVENDIIRRLAAVTPYDTTTEKRCTPLLQRSEAELQSIIAGQADDLSS